MPFLPRQHLFKSLGFLLCLMLASCEGSPWGNSVEKTLEPDPRLLDEETTTDRETSTGETATSETATGETASETTSETTSVAEPASVSSEPDPDPPTDPADAVVLTGAVPNYTDIGEAPEELQQYIEDLVTLDVLMLIDVKADDNIERNPNEFLPNQIITRREYARWLLAVNNHFYRDQSTQKIRPAVETAQPVFQDVGKTNIDFAAIQGLAEAGIIPSPLNGSTTAVKFRPDAPLTRQDLILWKVPLDTRTVLPAATAEAVTDVWGFQDAGKIEPLALKAVLTDHSNGEFANIRRALGYTTLFQPDKGVTRSEAAAVLWRFGNDTGGITAAEVLAADEAESPTKNEPKSPESVE